MIGLGRRSVPRGISAKKTNLSPNNPKTIMKNRDFSKDSDPNHAFFVVVFTNFSLMVDQERKTGITGVPFGRTEISFRLS